MDNDNRFQIKGYWKNQFANIPKSPLDGADQSQGGINSTVETSATITFPLAFSSRCLTAAAWDANTNVATVYFTTGSLSKTNASFCSNIKPDSFFWISFGV